jgi:hypothetical protein
MYYLQVGITIVLMTGIAFSLIYSFVLVVNLVKKRSNKIETIKRTFITTFCGWLSMFLIGLIWQNKADWDARAWISFLVITISISLVVAFFFALSFWSWKQ